MTAEYYFLSFSPCPFHSIILTVHCEFLSNLGQAARVVSCCLHTGVYLPLHSQHVDCVCFVVLATKAM